MKNKLLYLAFILILNAPLPAMEESSPEIRSPRLHEAAKRSQRLVFIPETPGSEKGTWRITWEGGESIAELLLPHPIKLPAFEKTLRIEMILQCEDGAELQSLDLRLLDAKGEVCMFVSSRKANDDGTLAAVWKLTPESTPAASWGKSVDKKLDLPAGITNFAFRLRAPARGDVTINALRIAADEE